VPGNLKQMRDFESFRITQSANQSRFSPPMSESEAIIGTPEEGLGLSGCSLILLPSIE
jgi:hypothetical protein